jgi:hypothetical protein
MFGGTPCRRGAPPKYGAVQQDADLTQCRKRNSQVIAHSGYNATTTETKLDEPAVQTCMTTLGWQAAKP